MARECKGCPDRFVGKDENGRWTTCPDYAKIVERSRQIQEARQKVQDNRYFDRDAKAKVHKIIRHNRKKQDKIWQKQYLIQVELQKVYSVRHVINGWMIFMANQINVLHVVKFQMAGGLQTMRAHNFNDITLEQYIKQKIKILGQLNVKLTDEQLEHIKSLKNETAVDNYARDLIGR